MALTWADLVVVIFVAQNLFEAIATDFARHMINNTLYVQLLDVTI
jgi:hypothetical protein